MSIADQTSVDLEILTVAVYPRLGGMTSWVDQVARGLSARGWNIRLVGFSDAWSPEYAGAPFTAVHIPMASPKGGITSYWDKWSRWNQAASDYGRGVLPLPRPRRRLVDSTPGILQLAERLLGYDRVPWAVLAGGDIFEETCNAPFASILHRRILRSMEKSTRIYVDGEDLRKALARRGVAPGRLEVLYHGIDIAEFDLHRKQSSRFFPPGTAGRRMAWHGKHADYNGPLRFIQIASKIGGGVPRLCGDGPQRPSVEQRLAAIGRSDWWVGGLPQCDVAPFLSEATFGIYPFHRMAGVPRALLESMAAGNVTLATPCGAVREVVSDGENGILCESESDFMRAVSELMSEPERCETLAAAARQTVEDQWSLESSIASIAQRLESDLPV